ncbi:hypothetical protein [Formosa agariphila]|nr:hypothetical protein [Formosa agariphila]
MIICIIIQVSAYAQSKQDMTAHSITIPLKSGTNPSFQFETLHVESANVVIQADPTQHVLPNIQLELNSIANNTTYSTFLWHHTDAEGYQSINYPKAFQNYIFKLTFTTKDDIALVVKKIDFEMPFYIELGRTASIENLNMTFVHCIGEWSEDIHGNQHSAFNTYNISLSEEHEQHNISFTSLDCADKKKLLLTWKQYTFIILEDSDKALKLQVSKI